MSNAAQEAALKRRHLILENFVPYRIVALGHGISGRLARVYENENITIPEWRVLAVISQAERVAARDVTRMTPMDKMAVSRAVASLETKGFVLRETDSADRRVNTLSLSSSGRALFERIEALALEVEDDLLRVLTPEERRIFDTALAKLETAASE